MKILDNLKKIFDTKFSDILNNNKIVFLDFSKNNNYVLEKKSEDKLSIDISKATPKEKKLIKENILDVNFQEKGNLLKNSSYEKTKQIKESLPESDDKKLLEFYRDKLTPEMYYALEASLVIRKSFKKGQNITELKWDIVRKYPSFGNNLCNMTTQGYFEDHFYKMYHEMLEDNGFDIRLYQNKVKWIIKALPYTVFVTKYK
ncbi:MAG: hypothetical protein KAQ92_04160, partial [Candidatus Aenigmarchaeota archaeon]|nr:hypothetical protein [Candidatus Aenigmarchaeota archaeon]